MVGKIKGNITHSIIIVVYNSPFKMLSDVITSVAASSINTIEIIVVNNNINRNQEFNKLFELDSRIRVINSNCNAGYSRGNNIGAKYSRGDTLLFLNPDAIIPKNLLEYSDFEYKELCKNVGNKVIFCPRIDSLSGIYIFRKGVINALGYAFMDIESDSFLKEQDTDFVSGCCIYVKKEDFMNIGQFNEKYFMYYDDTEFSIRARLLNYKLFVLNDIGVTHLKTDDDYALTPDKYYNVEKNRLISFFNYNPKRIRSIVIQSIFEPIALIYSFLKQGFLLKRIAIYKYMIKNIREFAPKIRKSDDIKIFSSGKIDAFSFFIKDKKDSWIVKQFLNLLIMIIRYINN
ncbi:MAG: glycosyltransferase [Promethearchaeota archaeon]